MADYTQDLIRVANAAVTLIHVSDGSEADRLWEALETLPPEIRLALDSPVTTTAEWDAIFEGAVARATARFDDEVTSDVYHVEPS